jgi:uncharacterized protein (TIGR02217 family)
MSNAVGPFVDSRLPEDVERGAQGGPSFSTGIQTLESGYEKRNINWSQARAKYDVGYGIQYVEDLNRVRSFFYARRGRAVGFRFKDWTDFEFDQTIGTGVTGVSQKEFQCFKRYEADNYYYDRTLYKLVQDTVIVRINGVQRTSGFFVNVNSGVVTLDNPLNPGDVLEAAGEFDVPVRFDTDEFTLTAETWEAGSIASIPLIELKDYESYFSGT